MGQSSSAGEQLDSETLYQRQKAVRERGDFLPAPAIVAVGLTVPENLGMVLRLADAAGAARVVFVNEDAPLRTRVHKTARGADTLVPWEVVNLETFLQNRAALSPLIAVELTTRSTKLYEAALPQAGAFVIGSEANGIPHEVLAVCERAVHIPMFGVNGSMNVTHALAVVLFEWRRQYPGLRAPV